MKTKYKILIISVMVLSILACFMITSFAAYTKTDITINNVTYTYNTLLKEDKALIVNNLTKFETYTENHTLTSYNNNDIAIYFEIAYDGQEGMNNGISVEIYNYSTTSGRGTLITTIEHDETLSILLYGDYSCQFVNSTNITNKFVGGQYNVYQDIDYLQFDYQVNLIDANQPNPLDKVNDFLTYLSTSLNKLTTMILANQILILFIVAVPVVSFVIGSFKRIKDSGRV